MSLRPCRFSICVWSQRLRALSGLAYFCLRSRVPMADMPSSKRSFACGLPPEAWVEVYPTASRPRSIHAMRCLPSISAGY